MDLPSPSPFFRYRGEEAHGPAALCVPLQLCRLFLRLERSSTSHLSTSPLLASFGWSHADALAQHDAHELCSLLLSALAKYGLLLENLFRGEATSTLRCLSCGREGGGREGWSDLQLGVEGCDHLSHALGALVEGERLEGEDAWYCEGCEARVTASREWRIDTLPQLLMIQLNRFTYDPVTVSRRKLNHRITTPLAIEMSGFTTRGGNTPGADVRGELWYDCFALLLHSGSAQVLLFASLRPFARYALSHPPLSSFPTSPIHPPTSPPALTVWRSGKACEKNPCALPLMHSPACDGRKPLPAARELKGFAWGGGWERER